MTSLCKVFSTMKNKRVDLHKKHELIDVIILSILAVLSGAESYNSIELFGRENFAFLKQFLKLETGIPSHDTITAKPLSIEPLDILSLKL